MSFTLFSSLFIYLRYQTLITFVQIISSVDQIVNKIGVDQIVNNTRKLISKSSVVNYHIDSVVYFWSFAKFGPSLLAVISVILLRWYLSVDDLVLYYIFPIAFLGSFFIICFGRGEYVIFDLLYCTM